MRDIDQTKASRLAVIGNSMGNGRERKERPRERCSFVTATTQREVNSYQHEGRASARAGSHSSVYKMMLSLYLLLHRAMSACSSGTSSSVGSQAAQ